MSDLTDGTTSRVHDVLARYVIDLQRATALPIYPQGGLARVLAKYNIPLMGRTRESIANSIFDPKYFGTYEVVLEQKAGCAGRYSRIIPVQVTPAIWRAIWVYEKLGFTVVIPPDIPHMIFQNELSHWRWRRAITAYPYELAARLVYLFKGYI
jgi:hypothetical protein